ncbi:MAG: hypothetical protein Q9227_002922 [Pyrenula ochraceoflavens]
MPPAPNNSMFIYEIDLRLIDPRIIIQSNQNLTSAQPGNYDHPPASDRGYSHAIQPRPPQLSDVSTGLQHLRELIDSDRVRDRDQRQRVMETVDREVSAEPLSARIDRRRRELEARAQEPFHGSEASYSVPRAHGDSDTIPIPQAPNLARSQRRPTRPSDRFRRQMERYSSGSGPVPPAPRTDNNPPNIPHHFGSPDIVLQEYRDEADFNSENRSNAKRRKLDVEGSWKRTSYTHFGQVVPGSLQMELVSCDGGQYMKDTNNYLPRHVLRDDSNVYCTTSNQANILIRHVGGIPFSLTKLVIKAPKTGYDSAIQQGIVFVSMSSDDILERTDMYRIKYSGGAHRARRHDLTHVHATPSQEYLNASRSPLRSLNHSFISHHGPTTPVPRPDNDSSSGPAVVPGFTVVHEYDERPSDSPQNPNTSDSGALHEDIHTIFDWPNAGYTGSSDSNTSDEEDEEGLDRQATLPPFRRARNYDRRRLTPNTIETTAAEIRGNSTLEMNGNERSKDVLLPHAKFFMPKDKHRASVQFDPPV